MRNCIDFAALGLKIQDQDSKIHFHSQFQNLQLFTAFHPKQNHNFAKQRFI